MWIEILVDEAGRHPLPAIGTVEENFHGYAAAFAAARGPDERCLAASDLRGRSDETFQLAETVGCHHCAAHALGLGFAVGKAAAIGEVALARWGGSLRIRRIGRARGIRIRR